MIDLIIKLKVKDDIDAYKAVSRLSFVHEVEEATYKGKKYKFSKENKSKAPRKFLDGNFDKKQ